MGGSSQHGDLRQRAGAGEGCSVEELGQFAGQMYALSAFRIDNPDFFEMRDPWAAGVVTAKENHEHGPIYDVFVLIGDAGNINYYLDGGYVSAGGTQEWSHWGTDDGVYGDPEVGDLVLWFERVDDPTYGWASWRQPVDRGEALDSLQDISC